MVQVEQAILLMTFSPKELQFNEFRGFSKTCPTFWDLWVLRGFCLRFAGFCGRFAGKTGRGCSSNFVSETSE